MRAIVLLVLAGITSVFSVPVFAQNDVLVGEEDGLSETFHVVGFDERAEVVQLAGDTVKTNVALSSLSSNAQQRVSAWFSDNCFKSSSKLRVQVVEEKKESDVHSKSAPYDRGEETSFSYTITLENRSSVLLKDLEVKTGVFYRRDNGQSLEERILKGFRTVDLTPGEKVSIDSKTVKIRDLERIRYRYAVDLRGYEKESSTRIKDRMSGLQVLIRKKSWDGEILERKVKKGRVPRNSDWADRSSEG